MRIDVPFNADKNALDKKRQKRAPKVCKSGKQGLTSRARLVQRLRKLTMDTAKYAKKAPAGDELAWAVETIRLLQRITTDSDGIDLRNRDTHVVRTVGGRPMAPYRLPDGVIVWCDDTACKGAEVIGFTLADGQIVDAFRVRELP